MSPKNTPWIFVAHAAKQWDPPCQLQKRHQQHSGRWWRTRKTTHPHGPLTSDLISIAGKAEKIMRTYHQKSFKSAVVLWVKKKGGTSKLKLPALFSPVVFKKSHWRSKTCLQQSVRYQTSATWNKLWRFSSTSRDLNLPKMQTDLRKTKPRFCKTQIQVLTAIFAVFLGGPSPIVSPRSATATGNWPIRKDHFLKSHGFGEGFYSVLSWFAGFTWKFALE